MFECRYNPSGYDDDRCQNTATNFYRYIPNISAWPSIIKRCHLHKLMDGYKYPRERLFEELTLEQVIILEVMQS